MPSNKDSNSTLIATLDVAQTLATITDAGNYLIKIDPEPLAATEILLVEVFDKVLTGSTSQLVYSGAVRADQNDMIVSIPISVVFEMIVKITQSNGTKRTFDWAVTDMS